MAATVAFLAVFGSLFFTQLAELVTRLPDYVAQTVDLAQLDVPASTSTPTKILDAAADLARRRSPSVGEQPRRRRASASSGSIFGVLFDGLTVLVFAFYFSADGPRLRRAIGSWLPLRYQKVFVTVWDIAVTKTGGFVVSKVVLATMSAFFHCGVLLPDRACRTGCRWASSPVS